VRTEDPKAFGRRLGRHAARAIIATPPPLRPHLHRSARQTYAVRMSIIGGDSRAQGARFYDLQDFPDDVPFFRSLIPAPGATVLELGSGTGRVSLALADACAHVHGVELSAAMLALANQKRAALDAALRERVAFSRGDISGFELGRRFDLILAPFRVFQALELDEQVAGCLASIHRHIGPEGACVLTMFRPRYSPDELRSRWIAPESIDWEREVDGERIVAGDRRPRLDGDRLVLYPELFFRRYRDGELLEEVVMPIVMRCWYPEQLTRLLEEHGFEITGTWGGYHGEAFGEGQELIVRFRAR
jgi:SAM-dependent methyltransferase